MSTTAKTLREQILERNFLKKVSLVEANFGFSPSSMQVLRRYEGTIYRLEEVALGLNTFDRDEGLENIEIYTNGIFVFRQDFVMQTLTDALPRRAIEVQVVEILLNEKLAILCEGNRVLLNRLRQDEHQVLIQQLKESQIWGYVTGTTTND